MVFEEEIVVRLRIALHIARGLAHLHGHRLPQEVCACKRAHWYARVTVCVDVDLLACTCIGFICSSLLAISPRDAYLYDS